MDLINIKAPEIAVMDYLSSRPRWTRFLEWISRRRYRVCSFAGRKWPVFAVSHRTGDAKQAKLLEFALSRDWLDVPAGCREAYDEILLRAPGVIVIQWKRTNVCGCLGHRHVIVQESAFSSPHDVLGGEPAGEMDIAWERIRNWQALPLTDTALDSNFVNGTRAQEFHAEQFRLKILSVVLHEINHLVFPQEPEASVRERSLTFYREALGSYVQSDLSTLSFTIDRSFSRLG